MTYDDLNRFKDIEVLKTERLTLRRIYTSDVEDIYKYSSDGRVTQYLLWKPHITLSDTRRYLRCVERKYRRGEFYDWGIEYQGHIIGTCGFTSFSVMDDSAEIGYVLASEFWGIGIAAESLKKVLEYGFLKLHLNRIEGRFMSENERSLSVMKKCGMSLEGILKSKMLVKGAYRDIGICAITRSEYNNLLKLGTF